MLREPAAGYALGRLLDRQGAFNTPGHGGHQGVSGALRPLNPVQLALLTHLMTQEAQRAAEDALEAVRVKVFTAALSAFDPAAALKTYAELFEPKEEDREFEDFTPENAADVEQMLNLARRAGAIS